MFRRILYEVFLAIVVLFVLWAGLFLDHHRPPAINAAPAITR
jgi:hypothetical protein